MLSEPPALAGFVGAWHYAQGLSISGGDVLSWESFAQPGAPVVLASGIVAPTIVNGAPSFGGSTAPLQVTIGSYTAATVACAYKRSAASTARAFLAAMRDTDIANGTVRVEFPAGAVASHIPNIWREDPWLGGNYSPGPSGSSAPGSAIVASGENPRAYAWRPEVGAAQTGGSAGAYGFAAGSGAFLRLSDASFPFYGEIYAVAAWKHPASQAECASLLAWLESLPTPL